MIQRTGWWGDTACLVVALRNPATDRIGTGRGARNDLQLYPTPVVECLTPGHDAAGSALPGWRGPRSVGIARSAVSGRAPARRRRPGRAPRRRAPRPASPPAFGAPPRR